MGAFLIKNFTEIHANDNVNKLSQKLIFVLCKENKDIFTNRVGYGNAAGFLLGLNNEVEEKGEYSSEDEDGLDGGVNEWVEEKSEKEIHTKNTKPTNKPDLENLSKYGQYDQVTGQFKLNIDPFKAGLKTRGFSGIFWVFKKPKPNPRVFGFLGKIAILAKK